MILAHHVIICAYGSWLPNDPRGSGSDFVRSHALYQHGSATRVSSSESRAHLVHDRDARLRAKVSLCYSPVTFNGLQARAIGRGIAEAVDRSSFIVYACSILPNHIHVVVARHAYGVEKLAGQLKGEATKALAAEKLHPFELVYLKSGKRHSPWSDGNWYVRLNTPTDVRRAIAYVRNNPLKEGKPAQQWSFVRPYDGFLGNADR